MTCIARWTLLTNVRHNGDRLNQAAMHPPSPQPH